MEKRKGMSRAFAVYLEGPDRECAEVQRPGVVEYIAYIPGLVYGKRGGEVSYVPASQSLSFRAPSRSRRAAWLAAMASGAASCPLRAHFSTRFFERSRSVCVTGRPMIWLAPA